MAGSSICDNCAYYDYNEEYDEYECLVNLDEDELYRFMEAAPTNARISTPMTNTRS